MFTAKFQPAKNKQGLSKLTFIGTDTKEGVKKDGEPWSMFKINFDCMGKFYGTKQVISITTGFTYDPDNLLGKTLTAFGFELPEPETVEDEEGFEVVKPENLDDEGFEITEAPKLDVIDFLKGKIGTVFVASVVKTDRGFWSIDVDTLKPMTKKKS